MYFKFFLPELGEKYRLFSAFSVNLASLIDSCQKMAPNEMLARCDVKANKHIQR